MTKVTEDLARQKLNLTSKTFSNIASAQTAIIPAGKMHTFFGSPGRYAVAITNIDDSSNANPIFVYDADNHEAADENIPPLNTKVIHCVMDENGIRVFNHSGVATVFAAVNPV